VCPFPPAQCEPAALVCSYPRNQPRAVAWSATRRPQRSEVLAAAPLNRRCDHRLERRVTGSGSQIRLATSPASVDPKRPGRLQIFLWTFLSRERWTARSILAWSLGSRILKAGRSGRPQDPMTQPALSQPADRRVAHVIGSSNVRKHLAGLPTSNGSPVLTAGQLWLTAHADAHGHRTLPSLADKTNERKRMHTISRLNR
jgi:hypothetical protein